MKTPKDNIKRILVVEDEPAICSLCQKVLATEGFEVDIATNGEVAQGMIEKQEYDLLLLDIKMPVITGRELYQWLLKNDSQLASLVIFFSGSVMSEDTRIFIEQTGKPFLPKPFVSAELRTIVKETLETVGK